LKKEQNILSFKKTDLKKKQVGWVLLKKNGIFSTLVNTLEQFRYC